VEQRACRGDELASSDSFDGKRNLDMRRLQPSIAHGFTQPLCSNAGGIQMRKRRHHVFSTIEGVDDATHRLGMPAVPLARSWTFFSAGIATLEGVFQDHKRS